MTQTRKFSQFPGPSPIQNGDIVVGLRNGQNYQFTGVGSGGGGTGIVIIIDQNNHNLLPGDWVRVDNAGLYVQALANTAQNAEIVGTVLSVQDANQFTLQVIGFVDTGTFAGLIPGSVYFLSDVNPGQMTLNEPVTNGEVSLPVFIATSATQGYIRQWRGFIIGGQPTNQGGGGGNNPNIVIINQPAHGLNVGQFVRLNGAVDYIPAQADTLANSQAVGVVIQKIDNDNFVLQTEGYNVGAVTQDYLGNPLTPSTVYYLSPISAGNITSTMPVAVGEVTKPLFISEQTVGTTGIDAGYVLEQRPLLNSAADANPNIILIEDTAHGFNIGDWVYVIASQSFGLGDANSLATSQVVGVVINVPDADHFLLQTNGYNIGAVMQDDLGNPLVPGTVYYLSTTLPGAISALAPTGLGEFTKPLFICEQTFGITGLNTGFVLDQRPLPVNNNVVPSITTINQPGHGLNLGDVVRINGTVNYVKASASSFNNAQAVGVVIHKVDANNFVLQSEGYSTNTITQDDLGNNLVAGVVYYVSDSVPGKVTSIPPAAIGEATKPIFICEQAVFGNTSGYILPQRPLENTPGNTTPDITTIAQAAHGFAVGDWVYIDSTVGVHYALGDANALASSQVVGVVIGAPDVNHFILQTNGYNTGAVSVDELGNPVLPNRIYYLSILVPGALTVNNPTGAGQYSKPLYACEQTTALTGTNAGYILEQRPLAANQGTDPSVVTIHQDAHGLAKGDVVRLSGSINYVKALSNTLANAQAVGVVIQVIDINNFILQTEGYSAGAITTDAAGNPLVPAAIYYLSPTVAGKVTTTIPVTPGQATKPMFICERTGGAATAGYIMPQRPLLITPASVDPNIIQITQIAHGFVAGDWLYISGSITYAKGIATAFNTSQVVGVVILKIDDDNFVLQTSGYNVGAVTVDDAGNPVVAGTTYYLSTTVPGKLVNTIPVTIGQYTKPLYSCEQAAGITGTNAGYVLDQRPLPVATGGGGAGQYQFIMSYDMTNQFLLNITGLFAGYQDIKVIGEGLQVERVADNNPAAINFGIQFELGGVLITTNTYNTAGDVFPSPNGGRLTNQSMLIFVNSWSLNSRTIGTPGNQVFEFENTYLGINRNGTIKQMTGNYLIPPTSTPDSINYNLMAGKNYSNTAPLTGLRYSFLSAGTYRFTAGKISVYGTPIN